MERDHSRTPRGAGDDEVTALIWERERARSAKDFARADALREQLSSLGVTLYDKSATWQDSSGRRGAIPKWDMLNDDMGALSPSAKLEQQADVSELMSSLTGAGAAIPGSEDQHLQIKQLVLAREQARAAKEFQKADQIRDDLKVFGVEIYDKEKMWRSREGLAGVVLGYHGSQASDVEISTLVVQREKARQANNYAESDMIRDELKAWGVQIFDKDKEWKASDGRRGSVPTWGTVGSTVATADAVKKSIMTTSAPMGSPTGVDSNLNALQGQIVNAAAQLCNQGPAAAVLTLQLLQQAQGILPAGAAPGITSGVQGLTQNRDVQKALTFCNSHKGAGGAVHESDITWLVRTREKCRKDKDIANADSLRTAIRSIGIEVNDKEKRWVAPDGRSGPVPMWQDLP
mmetsp:Transcript_60132/g.143312  ORF Transcript_60132/g.143312 Transcript_60132/m.143312 type:complete len:403 (-) Transcript_60132:28-1236(-)